MRRIRVFWRTMFDVRAGEGVRTLFMSLHILAVLFAYYILRSVSRALFVHKFDIDQLPYLYILIAIGGGFLAYLYTSVAIRSSLAVAINWATGITVACLLAIWWVLRFDFDWMLYVFSIWVSLFSIITVSQGWLVAANVFDSREAKRLYGLIGLSAVVGAAFGGLFTASVARLVEPHDLLLAAVVMVLIAYGCVRVVAAQKNVDLRTARASEEEVEFAFQDMVGDIRRTRHLQVIMAIIIITFIVDVMVDFQFNALAKAAFPEKKDLLAFYATFNGVYLSLATFSLQLFLTTLIIRYFGVGGTLQIMPVVIGIASTIMIFVPRLASASAMRLSEAASRYTFNRTGMELLYLPLPVDLKNRTKAFIDIFVDRFGRGLGGLLLMGYIAVVEKDSKHPNMSRISGIILAICIFWIFLSAHVSREYLTTIRRRLESRRLDLQDARIAVAGGETITLLEKTLAEGTPRQAAYALGLLADLPGYDIGPHLENLARHTSVECRTKAFEAATTTRYAGLVEPAARALEGPCPVREHQAAAAYLVAVSPEGPINSDWIARAALDSSAARRALAAYVIGLHAQDSHGVLRQLLDDRDPHAASAACRSAGQTGNRIYFEQMVQRLGDHAVRGAAIEALAMYGTRVCGSLGDILGDSNAPLPVRRQIPRVLRLIREQRSVEVLTGFLGDGDPGVRAAVINALNRLRQSASELQFPAAAIGLQIQSDARQCLLMHAQLAPLRAAAKPRSAAGLLARTLDTRLRQSMESLFHLLGLRYSPVEINNTWIALESGRADRVTAAHDYLDSILERDIKRVVMPLLDTRDRIASHARDLLRIESKTAEAAVGELLRSGDSWTMTCAMAVAAEMKFKRLAPEIAKAGERAGRETVEVARAAAAALA